MHSEENQAHERDATLMPRRFWSLLMSCMVVLFLYLVLSAAFGTNESDAVVHAQHDPDLSYGIVIDAGSTGSRLFLYAFTSGTTRELISVKPVKDEFGSDVVKKVSPGLSSFEKNPADAAAYYKPLLQYASKYIPYDMQPITPVFIFATAGMRLLPKAAQENILNVVRTKLGAQTRLQILPEHIQVIDGKWEGIYSWIAVNYVLGRFNLREGQTGTTAAQSRDKTAGMIDMGGASVQIAFELPQGSKFAGPTTELVNLGAVDADAHFQYHLFVTTFLGFGVNEGAKKYERQMGRDMQARLVNVSDQDVPSVPDNCLPSHHLRLSVVEDGMQYVRMGTGRWDSCVSDLVKILKQAGDCSGALKCFFGGVEAPPVDLSSVELYGFSEYWYSMHDVLSLGGHYDHDQFEKMARNYCATRWKSIKGQYPNADEQRLEAQCFKSAWIHAVLHDGFHISELHHQFQSALRIRNQEVQWALGALIYQMRYFPLKNQIATGTHPPNSTPFYPILLIVGGVAVFAVFVALVSHLQRRGGARPVIPMIGSSFRREPPPAAFGYKKLAQEASQARAMSQPTLFRGDSRLYA